MADRNITLRGVAVHNLKRVDLDLPRQKLIVFCGVSGSGKTSLALDTLYAEGQRRYIESFSAYTRQFLQQLDKPAADRIEGLPPASRGDPQAHLPLQPVDDRHGHGDRGLPAAVVRQDRSRAVSRLRARGAARHAAMMRPKNSLRLPDGLRYMITFPWVVGTEPEAWQRAAGQLAADGFPRVIAAGRSFSPADGPPAELPAGGDKNADRWHVVVDRLPANQVAAGRLRDSLELAFEKGGGHCLVFLAARNPARPPRRMSGSPAGSLVRIDGQSWRRMGFSTSYRCEQCEVEYPQPRAAAVQFQQSAGGLPGVRGVRQRHRTSTWTWSFPTRRNRFAKGPSRPGTRRPIHHELEELLASGRRLRPAGGHAVSAN